MPYIFKVMINDCKKGCDIQDVNAVAGEPRLYANLTYDSGFKIVFGTEAE